MVTVIFIDLLLYICYIYIILTNLFSLCKSLSIICIVYNIYCGKRKEKYKWNNMKKSPPISDTSFLALD